MHTRTLGQGLQVSAIGLGAMGMSQSYGPNPGDRADMIGVLRGAVDRGVTFFDTAEVYGPYVNEELVGEALQPIRDQVVIATKFGWRHRQAASRRAWTAGPSRSGGSPRHPCAGCGPTRSTCSTSTASTPTCRSKTSPAPSANWSPARSATSASPRPPRPPSAAPTPSTRSPPCRANTRCGPAIPKPEVLPALAELGIGFVPFSPLGKGFLTGTVDTATAFTDGDIRATIPRFSRTEPRREPGLVDHVTAPRHRQGRHPGQIALAWLLAQHPWIVPIPGTRRTEPDPGERRRHRRAAVGRRTRRPQRPRRPRRRPGRPLQPVPPRPRRPLNRPSREPGSDAYPLRRCSLIRRASASWSSKMMIRQAASSAVPWSTSSRARAASRNW